jgi:hypothetical protein
MTHLLRVLSQAYEQEARRVRRVRLLLLTAKQRSVELRASNDPMLPMASMDTAAYLLGEQSN